MRIGDDVPSSKHLKTASIVLFDCLESFVGIAKDIKGQTNPRTRHPQLVYIPGASELDIQANIKDGAEIDNVAFLMNENKRSIEIVSK